MRTPDPTRSGRARSGHSRSFREICPIEKTSLLHLTKTVTRAFQSLHREQRRDTGRVTKFRTSSLLQPILQGPPEEKKSTGGERERGGALLVLQSRRHVFSPGSNIQSDRMEESTRFHPTTQIHVIISSWGTRAAPTCLDGHEERAEKEKKKAINSMPGQILY